MEKDTEIVDGKDYVTDYNVPGDEAVIWRFMDFSKFVSLLKDKALFMTRADKFEDKFEGAVALMKDAEKYDEALEEYYSDITNGQVQTRQLVKDWHFACELLRKNSFINCWCESNYESLAMWKLYASGHGFCGVAIKTTVGSLRKAIGHQVEIGRIDYVDYSKAWLNVNEALWRKRLSFEYEHEVRVRIIPEKGLLSAPPESMHLSVRLDDLMEAVYVSPMAGSWFRDVVKDVMLRYGINKPVFHSALDDEGLF